jgi:hypothetical protein
VYVCGFGAGQSWGLNPKEANEGNPMNETKEKTKRER